jgi:hypothetical protein
VPYELGYGEMGQRGRNIPGYTALIVDIEVLSAALATPVPADRAEEKAAEKADEKRDL